MKVSQGFYDAIVLPHCKIRFCTCIMYYLDAFLHDFMSQVSQNVFLLRATMNEMWQIPTRMSRWH